MKVENSKRKTVDSTPKTRFCEQTKRAVASLKKTNYDSLSSSCDLFLAT